MSSWSSYYQAIGGAGRLSRLIKETKQRQILLDAVSNEIPDPEQLSISRSWASLSGTNDKLSGGISRQVNDAWKLPLEPYRKLKYWAKFDSGLKVKDWSYHGNVTRLKSKTVRMPQKQLVKDDGITEGQVYGIFDGENQWAEVENSSSISFSELLMEEDEVTLTVFFSPFGSIDLDDDEYGDLFYKVDSDEVKYAYRARIKIDGTLKFTVIDNHAVYDLETPPGAVPLYDSGDFDAEDFDAEDFDTTGTTLHQSDPQVQPNDWTIYTFTYNTVTKSMKICSAWVDSEDPTDRHVQVEAQTTFAQNITGLSMHLPLNEGNGTNVHDASGQGNTGFIAPAPNNPVWEANTNLLKFTGNNQSVGIVNSPELNTFTSLTIAFKLKLTSYSQDAAVDVIMHKNSPTGNFIGVGGFVVYMMGSASKTLLVAFKNNAGVQRAFSVFNAIPNLNQWYNVIITYDGTTYNLKVGGISSTPLVAAGDTFTSSANFTLGDTTSSFQGYLADVHVHKGRVWTSADESYFSNTIPPGYKGGFPIWQPLPPPEPEIPGPITRPITKIYDVPQPTAANTQEFKLNNPASTTPFAEFYNVPGGAPVTDPEVLKYTVEDGTVGSSTTNPWATPYSLSPASSTGNLVAGELAYGQYIINAASAIEGIKPTEITVYLKKNNASGGNVFLGIIKADGSTIKFGTAIPVSSIPTDWTSFLKAGNNVIGSQYTTVVGDAIGVIWEGASSGTLNIQRGGSGVHFESSSLSAQNIHDGTEWGNPNSSFSMAGVIRTGGETVPGANPFFKLGSTYRRAAFFQLNSTLENIVSSKVIYRVRRVGSAASATLICTIRNSTNVVLYTFPETVSFNSISTSVQDLQFVFGPQTVAWADNHRISLEWSVVTGINDTTNYLEINYNVGPGNAGMVGGNTIKGQAYRATGTVGWYDLTPTGTDWAGKIYTGGNNFVPWVALNDTRKRYGEKIAANTPAPVAKGMSRKVTKATFTLRKVGDPQDTITFKIYSGTTAVAQSFNQINAASISATETSYDFTWVFNNYVTVLNDYLVIEYNSGTAANYIEVKINTDAAAGAAGDGQKMIAVEFVNNAWVTIPNRDVSAVFQEGGVPDLTSRNRVAVNVVTEASLIKTKKVTEASFYFKIFGTVTGSIEIRSRRGSDDTPRDLLGTIPVSGLNSTTWLKKTVILRTAVHFLGVSDKISIEYSGGNQTNYVRVMMNPADIFDGDNTQMTEYNSVTWSTPIDNLEIVGELFTGGDVYTPDPGTPYVAPESAYNHNLFICAGGGLSQGNKGHPLTFAGGRIRDLRIVAGDPAYATLTSLENFVLNRHTILPILKGQVALAAYTTAKE